MLTANQNCERVGGNANDAPLTRDGWIIKGKASITLGVVKSIPITEYSDVGNAYSTINSTIENNIRLGSSKTALLFCNLEEQQQIVQEIDSRFSVCDMIEETITNSLKQAEALRQGF